MTNEINIYSVLRPIFLITKLCGLSPFKTNKWRYQNSKVDAFWTLILLVFTFYSVLQISDDYLDQDEVFIEIVTQALIYYLTIAGTAGAMLVVLCYSNKILKVIAAISDVDTEIQYNLRMSIGEKNKQSARYVSFGASCYAVMLIIILGASYHDLNSTQTFYKTFLTGVLIFACNIGITLQFCSVILLLRRRMLWLNDKVQSVITEMKNAQKINESTEIKQCLLTERTTRFLRVVRIIHYKIWSTGKEWNDAYSLQLFFIIAKDCITVISSIYDVGWFILTSDIQTLEIIQKTVELLISLLQTLILIRCCSETAEQAKYTAVLIHKVATINRSCFVYNKELQLEVAVLSAQILHHPLTFTAWEMFEINESLLFSMTGAITTYLVIVLQFEFPNVYPNIKA